MSITAKITALTNPNRITIGKDVFNILHPEIKERFTEIKLNPLEWKYWIERQANFTNFIHHSRSRIGIAK